MSNFLDFLPPREVAYELDAPTRNTPPVNQGGRPNGPQRLTGRQIRRLRLFSESGGPPIQRVIELNRFPSIIPVPFSLTAIGSANAQLIVSSPDRDRILLIVRNAATSAGSLFIGFGAKPDVNTALISLVSGGQLILDTVIPQDDVWISTDVATTLGVVSYANSEYVL